MVVEVDNFPARPGDGGMLMTDDELYIEEEWEDDEEDEESDDLLECPSCRGSVHEDTQQCPHCGDWIVPVWPQRTAKRVVWIVAALLVIIAMLVVTIL